MLLIAEISNMHLGSLPRAKELIRRAVDCGADLVKAQAFKAHDMISHGTMPAEFYHQCAFKYDDFLELMYYAELIGTKFFCSIISSDFAHIEHVQPYMKITAKQTQEFDMLTLAYRYDNCRTFVSMNTLRELPLQNAHVMYAEKYNQPFEWDNYGKISCYYRKPVGISHHNKNVSELLAVIKTFRPPVVEKHFYLGEDIVFKGQLYRDCLHAADEKTFQRIASLK